MVVQPLHSSFILRPHREDPQQLHLTYSAVAAAAAAAAAVAVAVAPSSESVASASHNSTSPEVSSNEGASKENPETIASSKAIIPTMFGPDKISTSHRKHGQIVGTERAALDRQPLTGRFTHTSSSTYDARRYDSSNPVPPFPRGRKRLLFPPPCGEVRTAAVAGAPESSQPPRRMTFRPFDNMAHRHLPSDFEPPVDEEYWKRRCFHWQDICQQNRKRVREMEEDQRQLRRRIGQLENQVLQSQQAVLANTDTTTRTTPSPTTENHQNQNQNQNQIPVSPTSTMDNNTKERPPTWIVTVPKVRRCCFYLTDSEGLSDSEDYVDEVLDELDTAEQEEREVGDDDEEEE